MPFSLVDSFGRTLGKSLELLENAEDKIEELGEAAGEVSIVETVSFVEDDVDITDTAIKKTGKSWMYDFVHEKFVEQ